MWEACVCVSLSPLVQAPLGEKKKNNNNNHKKEGSGFAACVHLLCKGI